MIKSRIVGLALCCAALFTATAAKADPISAAIVAGIGLTGTAATIATAVITLALTTVGSMVATRLLAPGQKAQDRQASITTITIGEGPREALFGEAATAGSLSDAFNYGGTNGTDWEVMIVVVADHRCHSLTGFYVADVYVPFTGNGPVAGYNGQLEVYWLEGTEAQVMPPVVTTHGDWDADSNLAGCATVVVAYKADSPKTKNPIWTAGRPQFLWVVKGKHCYIPRLDSTVPGGSGPHRWEDPSTWQWTDNVIDCRYNWMRGVFACDRIDQPDMLLVGRGLSAIEAPPARTIAAANVCDELVPLKAGGSEKRYRLNAVIRADEEFISTEELFAAACAGVIVQREGGVEIEPGAARSVVAEFTDDDLIIGEKVTVNRFKGDAQRVNSVVPRYVEPTQKWADHAAPIRRVLADIAEDGRPREQPLTLSGVTSGTQAQRCGEIARRLARLERSGGFTVGPRWAAIEDGDWIGWTSARHFKGERKVFRVSRWSRPANWRNTIAFDEISAECFDWNPAVDELTDTSVAEQQAPPPADADPEAGDWILTAITLSADARPALHVEGGTVDTSVLAVLVEYRVDDGTDPDLATDWLSSGGSSGDVAAVVQDIPGVLLGTPYLVSVRYIFFGGGLSDRLILGPVTTSTVATPVPTAVIASAEGGAGEASITVQAPPIAGWTDLVLRRGTSTSYGASVIVGDPFVPGLYQTVVVIDDGLAAGTYRWWVEVRDGAGAEISHSGPVTATVT